MTFAKAREDTTTSHLGRIPCGSVRDEKLIFCFGFGREKREDRRRGAELACPGDVPVLVGVDEDEDDAVEFEGADVVGAPLLLLLLPEDEEDDDDEEEEEEDPPGDVEDVELLEWLSP